MNKPALDTTAKLRILTAAIILSGAVIGWNLVLSGDLRTLSDLKKGAGERALKQETTQNIERLKASFRGNDSFMWTNDTSLLVESLNQMAKESGLKLTSVSPLDPVRDENYEKLPLRLEAEGGYHELGRFISKVESSAKLIKVSEATIQKNEGILKILIVLSVFRTV